MNRARAGQTVYAGPGTGLKIRSQVDNRYFQEGQGESGTDA